MSSGIARLGRCDVGNSNINDGLGGGLWHIKINSQMRMYEFSATWCLLSQHMASLASNSSEMDS
jgi:hypothetical protein